MFNVSELTLLTKLRLGRRAVGRENLSIRRRVTESLKVLEGPDYLLLAIHFDNLRIGLGRMTVPNDDVAAGQFLERCHPS